MATTTVGASELRTEGRYFYLWMAAGYVVVAFGGFARTYWLPVAARHFNGPPILHIHGLLLSVWVLFYFAQSYLIATHRVMRHRNWGLAGIAIFTLVMCSILMTQLAILKEEEAAGFIESGRRFAAVPLCGVPLMVTLFTLAIVYVRRPELHKRFMVLLMSAMMTPAIARVFLALLAPAGAGTGASPPPFVTIPPALVADLFIVTAIVRDWRVIGRPHRVYVFGLIAVVTEQLLAVKFASTDAWMATATAFQGLLG